MRVHIISAHETVGGIVAGEAGRNNRCRGKVERREKESNKTRG